MRRPYIPSAPCVHCGMVDHHVNHHDPEYRATGPLSGNHDSYGGLDYYTWADIVYHPYEPTPDYVVPVVESAPRRSQVGDAYRRGYQAGYHAGMRRAHQTTADAVGVLDEAVK